jgi:hypothetical protein|tara:strand:- start:372 stop:590 length:219 start_codon:yes stop_codon:yes gene_type:complete
MDKFFLKSKTIWGAIVAALPGALTAIGVDWPSADTESIGGQVVFMLDSWNEAIGAALVVWGRIKAVDTLKLW